LPTNTLALPSCLSHRTSSKVAIGLFPRSYLSLSPAKRTPNFPTSIPYSARRVLRSSKS